MQERLAVRKENEQLVKENNDAIHSCEKFRRLSEEAQRKLDDFKKEVDKSVQSQLEGYKEIDSLKSVECIYSEKYLEIASVRLMLRLMTNMFAKECSPFGALTPENLAPELYASFAVTHSSE
ncbi:hypothetical protein BU23DRAFT_220108 [Bimuria novae-zelandiae CBS 107.79]|uniref:Uncharacterized protein n=1 Tax=Bimuria novae-zelandiae CBS 107.79 TaxID=1447943 RepID=A0A6A5UZG9_9PLEO|nr:hypothetical protein BU23DRAFT_220108 [Bimuria novae-zelandiae CBS 107.79]